MTPQKTIYKWYISGIYCQLSDYIFMTYHLLREPETAIDYRRTITRRAFLVVPLGRQTTLISLFVAGLVALHARNMASTPVIWWALASYKWN